MNLFQGLNFGLSGNFFSIGIDWFHSFCCSVLFGVFLFVFIAMGFLVMYGKCYKLYGNSYQVCEFIGSFLPIMVLFFMIYPSLSLLYEYGSLGIFSCLSVGVVGHQWYWSYEYGDYEDVLNFDSYMLSLDDLSLGDYRLLEVDNRCIVPSGVDVNFNITSEDVIHSWALPSVCVKVDAISGMVSRLVCSFPFIGVFYGQCSEICGAFHSFMPIVLEVTLPDNFVTWVLSFM